MGALTENMVYKLMQRDMRCSLRLALERHGYAPSDMAEIDVPQRTDAAKARYRTWHKQKERA